MTQIFFHNTVKDMELLVTENDKGHKIRCLFAYHANLIIR
jgi:hypothetical protein